MRIQNGTLVLPDRLVPNGSLIIDESSGRIAAVGPESELGKAHPGETIIDARGGLIAPGFIDLHSHGGWDGDFTDGTPEAFAAARAYHAGQGTTALLATTASARPEALLDALAVARALMSDGAPADGSELLGVHLEGPWLNPARKGCHLERDIRLPDAAEVRRILAYAPIIRHVTLAPEMPGALELTAQLAAAGITVAAGHTDMTYTEMLEAIAAGVRHVTHLFCAMSTTIRRGAYRYAGVLETTLIEDRVTTEVIADGKHLPTALVRLAHRCKGADGLAIVSDAMRGAGMPPGGRYTFGARDGAEVVIDDGVAMLPDRSAFASSTTPLRLMVKHCVEAVGLPLLEAVRMASLVPARIAGVAGRKGSLEPGKDGDVCLLDEAFGLRAVVLRGRLLDPRRLRAHAPAEALAIGSAFL